jgi:hypothetical protein
MNFEICKKCPYDSKYLLFAIDPEIGKFQLHGKNCHLYCNDIEFYKFLEKERYVIEKNILNNNLKAEPSKSCPYYMEHQLNEWNK